MRSQLNHPETIIPLSYWGFKGISLSETPNLSDSQCEFLHRRIFFFRGRIVLPPYKTHLLTAEICRFHRTCNVSCSVQIPVYSCIPIPVIFPGVWREYTAANGGRPSQGRRCHAYHNRSGRQWGGWRCDVNQFNSLGYDLNCLKSEIFNYATKAEVEIW